MIKTILRNKYVFLMLFIVIPAFIALTQKGYFPMHDDIQGMRVLQMHKCVLDFQIPCRWVPDMGFGYGYPQFNYYAPLPYYVMESFVLFGVGILSSVKIGFGLSIIGSAISMYLLGSRLWGKTGGIISALFYTYAPYRAVDIYVRGAMGEAWAFIFLPLVLLYTLKILDGKRAVFPLALALAGLALTHNVTVIMFIPFYALFIIFLKKLNINSIKNLFFAGIWGISLSAFFSLPAFLEKEYVHVETILQGYFNYLAHFVGIKQLLFSTFWGYGSSTLGPLDGMALSVGILHWTTPLLVVALLVYLKKIDYAKSALVFLSLGFGALFLIHPKSQFIWQNIGIFSYIQFPWRFLAISILFFSLAVGAVGKLLKENKKYLLGGLFVSVILLYGSSFAPSKYLYITDVEKFRGDSWRLQQTISIFDYLPKSAKAPPASAAPELPYSEGGEIEILNVQKGTDWQKWRIVSAKTVKVLFPTFYFPGWRAEVNGLETAITSDNDLGLITLELAKGDHNISLKLADTPLRAISNIISLLALLFIPIYAKKYAKK